MEPGEGVLLGVALRAVVAGAALWAWAWFYDQAIGRWEARGWHEGYVSFLVVGGVLGVLAVSLAVVWPLGAPARLAVGIVGLLFGPAGLPMIWGSVTRHAREREQAQARLRQAILADLDREGRDR